MNTNVKYSVVGLTGCFFNIQLFPVIKITGNKKDIEYTRLTAKMCWGSNPLHHNDYRKGNEYEC